MKEDFKNFPLALARNSSKFVLNLGTPLKNISQPRSRLFIVGFCGLVDYQVFHGPSIISHPYLPEDGRKIYLKVSTALCSWIIFYLPRRVEMSYFFQPSSLVTNMRKAAHFI
jgi:hypothetical protein